MHTVQANLKYLIARSVLAIGRSGSVSNAIGTAEANGDVNLALMLKSAVSPMTSDSIGALIPSRASNDWIEASKPLSITRRLPMRQALIDVPIPTTLARGTSYWVPESGQIPVTRFSFGSVKLAPRKVASICVLTKELTNASNAEAIVDAELRATDTLAVDTAFIDPANAGIAGTRPASITYQGTGVAATGDPSVDLAALLAAFGGDLSQAFLITDPRTAASLALHRDSAGAYMFPDVGVRGGSVLGIPLLTSTAVPSFGGGGMVALVDSSGIVFADAGVEIDESYQSDLAMLDDPAGASQMISLWQVNAVAVRLLHSCNWEVARTGAVAYLSGVEW